MGHLHFLLDEMGLDKMGFQTLFSRMKDGHYSIDQFLDAMKYLTGL